MCAVFVDFVMKVLLLVCQLWCFVLLRAGVLRVCFVCAVFNVCLIMFELLRFIQYVYACVCVCCCWTCVCCINLFVHGFELYVCACCVDFLSIHVVCHCFEFGARSFRLFNRVRACFVDARLFVCVVVLRF